MHHKSEVIRANILEDSPYLLHGPNLELHRSLAAGAVQLGGVDPARHPRPPKAQHRHWIGMKGPRRVWARQICRRAVPAASH